jgi:hypothetical protein
VVQALAAVVQAVLLQAVAQAGRQDRPEEVQAVLLQAVAQPERQERPEEVEAAVASPSLLPSPWASPLHMPVVHY